MLFIFRRNMISTRNISQLRAIIDKNHICSKVCAYCFSVPFWNNYNTYITICQDSVKYSMFRNQPGTINTAKASACMTLLIPTSMHGQQNPRSYLSEPTAKRLLFARAALISAFAPAPIPRSAAVYASLQRIHRLIQTVLIWKAEINGKIIGAFNNQSCISWWNLNQWGLMKWKDIWEYYRQDIKQQFERIRNG